MTAVPTLGPETFHAEALLLGERIGFRSLGEMERLAAGPPTIAVPGGGIAMVFRYGVVVLFDVNAAGRASLMEQLKPLVLRPFGERETEEVQIRVDPHVEEGIHGNTVFLHDASIERMQIVAAALSKSVVLGNYETRIAQSFDIVEPLAMELGEHGRTGLHARKILRQIGSVLLSEHKMIGRAEIGDKPEVLWNRPDLESLHARLEDEYEIRDRYAVLDRRLELIYRTARTVLDLLQYQRTLRVEWYIVVLIAVEIFLSVYGLFFLK
jgi:uncharacterized Rmd1/YagE family protein